MGEERLHQREIERLRGEGDRFLEELDLGLPALAGDDADRDAPRLERLDEGVEDAEGAAEVLRRDPDVQAAVESPGADGVPA